MKTMYYETPVRQFCPSSCPVPSLRQNNFLQNNSQYLHSTCIELLPRENICCAGFCVQLQCCVVSKLLRCHRESTGQTIQLHLTPKLKAVRSFKISVTIYQSTRRNFSERRELQLLAENRTSFVSQSASHTRTLNMEAMYCSEILHGILVQNTTVRNISLCFYLTAGDRVPHSHVNDCIYE
jgi:hypothetical protein